MANEYSSEDPWADPMGYIARIVNTGLGTYQQIKNAVDGNNVATGMPTIQTKLTNPPPPPQKPAMDMSKWLMIGGGFVVVVLVLFLVLRRE